MTRLINQKSTSHINDLFPDDVIKLHECVGQISVLDLKKQDVEEYEEILVVESYSPSNFWIRPWKNVDPFNDMMEKLHVFYEANKSKYVIPKNAFQFGLHIACKYFNKWHRGIIKNTNEYPEVEVLFFDYGTVESYHAKELFFLQYSFGKLPAQAVLCGLFNIRPVDNINWPLETRQKFFNKSSTEILIAFVGKINEDNNSLLIDLVDTSTEEDCHIGDWLVENKLAQYGVNRIKSRNYLHEFDVQCGGTRPMFKNPSSSFKNSQAASLSKKSSSSSNEKNNNDKVNSVVMNRKNKKNDSSKCCHVCVKCGHEFQDHEVKKIEKKHLPNYERQLMSHDDVYKPENGFIPDIQHHGVKHSGTIDWSQFKAPANDKENKKKPEKLREKELTLTDNLKNVEKVKKNIIKIDAWYNRFVNKKNDVNDFVDVVRGEITPLVRNGMRSAFKDPPGYKKIIIPRDVNSLVKNDNRVSVSTATLPEDSSSLDDYIFNCDKKKQIVGSDGNKNQASTSTNPPEDSSSLEIFNSEKKKEIVVANYKNDQASTSPEDSLSLDAGIFNFENKKQAVGSDDKKEDSLMKEITRNGKMKFTDIIKSFNEKSKYSSNASELDSDDLSSMSMIEGENDCDEVEGWTFD